jgi:hypothetical protein
MNTVTAKTEDWRFTRVPDVVTELNYEIWEQCRDSYAETFKLYYRRAGTYECIEFLGQLVWDNEDICVPWDEKTKIPKYYLREFLLIRMAEEAQKLSTVLPVLQTKNEVLRAVKAP